MQMTQRLMGMAMAGQPGFSGLSLPPFATSPPIGLAVKVEPAELHAEIAVPSRLVKAFGDYVKGMQMIANPQNQAPVP
jgi:hypothetical protein